MPSLPFPPSPLPPLPPLLPPPSPPFCALHLIPNNSRVTSHLYLLMFRPCPRQYLALFGTRNGEANQELPTFQAGHLQGELGDRILPSENQPRKSFFKERLREQRSGCHDRTPRGVPRPSFGFTWRGQAVSSLLAWIAGSRPRNPETRVARNEKHVDKDVGSR